MMHDLTPTNWGTLRLTRLQVLVLTSGFALGLLTFRTLWTSQTLFWFLGWNLFLAWVPWALAQLIALPKLSPWLRLPLLGCWLLFLPNAPYILTDLFHLRAREGVPRWFDLLLILTFAWAGLTWGFAALRKVEGHVFRRWFRGFTPLVTAALLFLTAYGVYLGRYLRLNSWDLATQPDRILATIFDPFLHPGSNGSALGFSLGFGGFLLVAYALYAASEGREASPRR
jgi:uncharacterized membrane protein